MGERVDVLVITAAEGEDDGVRAVEEGRLGDWQKGERFGYPIWFATFTTPTGSALRVALARPVDMGGELTAATAAPLVIDFKPLCLAMSGVCGGRPDWANLGDVIIAGKTWRYDEGELVRRTSGAEPDLNQAVTTYPIAALWLSKAQATAKAWSTREQRHAQWPSAAAWLDQRPRDYELQGLWLLRELVEGRDPLQASDREQRCPNWGAVIAQLEERGWLLDADLTEAGRKYVRTTLFRNAGKLPEQASWQVHVGPVGTGNRLIRDVDIWATLAKTQRLVHGLDMEASALAQIGWLYGVKHTLVVKGVMDFAEPERHRGFRPFAARAAAEVLLRFLRENLTPRGGGLNDILVEGTGGAPPQNNPGTLLKARYEIVPFLEALRSRELALLRAWCDDPSPAPSVRVWTGPGGAGKTRLFIEECQRLQKQGWLAGFLPPNAEGYFDALDARHAPALLVLDYAETRFAQLEALLQHLGTRGRTVSPLRCRVALLARQGGEWLAAQRRQSPEAKELLGAADPIALKPLPVETTLRAPVFTEAARAFAERLGKSAPAAAPDLSDPRFERPLYVHLAALAAVEGRPLAPDALLEDAVDHERHFWKATQGEADALTFQRASARLVTALTLRGRTERRAMAALDGQVKGPGTERFHDLVADLYPAPAELGPGQVGGLEPDLLGETLVRGVLADVMTEHAYLEQVAQGAGDTEVATMLQTLGRIDLRAPEVTEHWLVAFLSADPTQRALPAYRAALALAEENPQARLGQFLARQLETGPPHSAPAGDIAHLLPEHTVSLRGLAAWVTRSQLQALPSTEATRAERARLQNSLGIRLSEEGRREEALQATQEAVAHYRALTEARPDAFRPDLATSLSNLGLQLSGVGRRQEALQAAQEAVALRRALAEARPDAFRPDLATSLSNLGIQLSEVGRRQEALEVMQEAVALRRALAEAHPDAFRADLASGLHNISIQLSRVGRREEALQAAQEAVAQYHALAEAHADAFRPDLATGLLNLGNQLSEVGRRQEALQATQEAVALRRALAEVHPDAFRPDLATSLLNLGTMLRGVGRHEKALEVTQEAVAHYRALAETHSEAFRPDLASSLHNLGAMLGEVGRHKEALQAAQEAVALRRALAEVHPDAFRADLASSLSNLGAQLSQVGLREEALQATQEAVAHYRTLVEAYPDAFQPDLAGSLNNLSDQLGEVGRREEALQAAQEAVAHYRTLAETHPDAFRPGLATFLLNLGNQLSEVGRREEALQAAQEAVALRRALAEVHPDAFRPDLASSLYQLGARLGGVGRREEALHITWEAVAHYRVLAEAHPDAFRPDLARSLYNLGTRLREVGRHEEALQAAQEAVALRRALAEAHPDAFRADLASSLNNLGAMLSGVGRREEALQAAQEAVAHYRALAETHSEAFRPALASSLSNLGAALGGVGRRQEALQATQEAVAHYRALAETHSEAFRPDLALSLTNLGNQLSEVGRHEEALQATQEAVAYYRTLAETHSEAFRPDLARSLLNLGAQLIELARHKDALQAAQEVVAHYRVLAEAHPNAFRPDLAMSLHNLGLCLRKLDRQGDCLFAWREAVTLFLGLFRTRPSLFQEGVARTLWAYTQQLTACGHDPSSDETCVEANAALAAAASDSPAT